MRQNAFDYCALGRRVRDLRQKKKLTQEELAELVGISESFVGHIERAEKMASMDTIVRLCDIFDVPADYLLRGKTLACAREKCPMYEEMLRVFRQY